MTGWTVVTIPGWWNERRYGMFVHASVATVASFSPIGEYAEWYWSHLGTDRSADGLAHPSPMAEVLAYHRDRWAHVERYDDFIPFLSYHRFDADEQLELATSSGMKYLVQVAKHHDGFCWWDAPGTKRTSVLEGPGRNVVAEMATACRRNDVVFGTSYSLLDWADDRYPDRAYVDEVLHPHVLDLVERYGSQILWGDGGWGHGPDVWRSRELIERAQDLADAQGYELVVNDGWRSGGATITTYDYNAPADIEANPWELRRGLGSSFCNNRAEHAEHMLSTGALFDLLTEVIAKGGNLAMNVGPGVDGTVPELQQRPLREVGAWIDDHDEVINGSRPFDQWGDAQIRYVRAGGHVIALDLTAGPEVTLTGLTPDRYEVSTVEADDGGALHWEQHRAGVTLSRIDRSPTGLAGVYRIGLREAPQAIRLFDASVGPPRPLQPLQPLLDAALPGDVVQLGEGRYQGPVEIPAGVTLRGIGWDRTSIVGRGATVARLAAQTRLEHVHLTNEPERPSDVSVITPIVRLQGAGAVIASCRCDGHVIIEGDDGIVQSVTGNGVFAVAVERITIERCAFKGKRQDVGVEIVGGSGHRISRNELVDHLCSVRLTDANASTVSENRFTGRWWAVHLVQCDHVDVIDNDIQHTMRAVDVNGGNGSIINGNWVADGDSGALVEFGATDTSLIDNHIERCRIGILIWDAPTTSIGPNTYVDLHDAEPVVVGPEADVIDE